MRSWYADITLFNEAGYTASEWRYSWSKQDGGSWTEEKPGSMPLSEMLAALAQLKHASPRMARRTWADWLHVKDGPEFSAPSWALGVTYAPGAGETPSQRLLDMIFNDVKPEASWDFPNEVGIITCNHWNETMAMIDYLLSKADAPVKVAA